MLNRLKALAFLSTAGCLFLLSCANVSADSITEAQSKITSQIDSINIEGKNYRVSAEYPVFRSVSGNSETVRQLNLAVQRFTQRLYSTRNRQFIEKGPGLDEDRLDAEAQNSVDITGRLKRAERGIVSIVFTRYTYIQGYAHGTMAVFGFNYDLQRGQVIGLGELFENGTNYVQQVSDHCDRDLKRQLGEFWSAGALSADDLRQFVLDRRGMTVLFSAYQVTSYAGGTPAVRIPFSKLKGLRKDYL